MINNKCIIFEYKGKFAHFLKAEANASAPSYPFPSRTVLLGLAGAILGLTKDSPQIFLKNAKFAVSGKAEAVHWHTANFRKDPPALLSKIIKKSDKGTSKAQRNTIIAQEWLFKPEFTIFAQLSEEYHSNFEYRIRNREWFFTPCLGLSEMMADLNFVDSVKAEQLEEGVYGIETLVRKSEVEFDMSIALEQNFVIKSIRMPRDVTDKREFSHEAYLYEANGESLYLKTATACKVGKKIISWL
ncbi:MAG: CRISPR-associated protein Cas5 [Deltaproteobacteria bacterium]|nr:CRISPR-associated protein Cas5 [Deltaproteobacteria bacterium]